MDNIPADIMQQIKDYANIGLRSDYPIKKDAAVFGYNLKLEEKDKEIINLKKRLVDLFEAMRYIDAGVASTEDNNIDYANAIIYAKELRKLKKENHL